MPDELTQPDRPTNRGHLHTELRNERSMQLDGSPTLECLQIINQEDQCIAIAIEHQIPHIARFTDLVIDGLRSGGRLIYLGAGTSGRLGVLDASECPPTFQSPPDQVIGLIAGGDSALRTSSEHKEDVFDGAKTALDKIGIGKHDVVLGIAAGGTTPYALGGIKYAKSIGASTGFLTCTPIDLPSGCDVLIAIETGPEVLTGSTRMKAGSATKMVLNMISTSAMVGLGKTYSNLMVDMRASNDKLKDRAARIVTQITNIDREHAFELLDQSNQSVKHAIVMHTLDVSFDESVRLLKEVDGNLRTLIGAPKSSGSSL
ncbi:MAG: N-acetylmuramic acid 6-phosphate etherase [Phycisphaerales bacterium]|nr:N-acetylmuramic acid 6-phosphate etherase [Phycisphaerales bacterium]